MKQIKKIMALVLATVMVLSMGVLTLAASIEIKDSATSDHEYLVYQIYTGTLTEKTDATTGVKTQTLSDIKYGSNYEGKTAGASVPKAELDAILNLAGTDKAREFANNMTDGNDTNGEISGEPIATLKKPDFKATGLADGYYLIIDDRQKDIATAGDMYSRYIVQVSGTTEIAPKKSTVEEHKEIKSDTHTPSDVTEDKSADDLSIGEDVTFTIDATVPLNAVDFDKFFFIINDTLSEGLTLKAEDISVYYMNGDNKVTLSDTTDYTLFLKGDTAHPADTGKTFQVALKDAKSLAGKKIYVEYTATLNEKAAIGEIPNTNKTTVTYSNNPEHKYVPDDENNDGKPDDGKNSPTGETPEQETKTFTSSIQIKKVDENKQPLTGAEFEITGTSVKTVVITTDVFTKDPTGTYYKLKDGTYTTAVPSVEDTYVSKGTGKSDGGYVKDGNTYRVATYDELNDDTTEIFKKVTATADQYEDKVDGKYETYKKETVPSTTTTTENVKAKAFVDANGIVKFDGLGAGTYTIKETTVPDGYNQLDDITVTISFDKDDADKNTENNGTIDEDDLVWSATSDYVKTDADNTGKITEIDSNGDSKMDTFQIQIENKKGTILPTTGGIGTTIFYVLGAILVIGAGVLLVTRRRMSAE